MPWFFSIHWIYHAFLKAIGDILYGFIQYQLILSKKFVFLFCCVRWFMLINLASSMLGLIICWAFLWGS